MSESKPKWVEVSDGAHWVDYQLKHPVVTINLQCNSCGWKLRSAPCDVVVDTSQDGERTMQRDIMREAEAAGWNVGKHRSDVDLCPGCAVAK